MTGLLILGLLMVDALYYLIIRVGTNREPEAPGEE